MITLGQTTKAYLVCGITDMRKSFDALAGIARNLVGEEVTSGHLFVFCNRRRNRLKVLFWDGSGLWVCAKRLERGCFRWLEDAGKGSSVTLSREEFMMIVSGLDPADFHQKKWFRTPE